MLRRSALDKVGLLDENFFMYGEDIDLSYRLLKGGYENWYIPATMLHYKGESAHKSSFRYVHVFYNAMLIFFRKHYGNKAAFVSLPIKAAIVVKATITLVKMQMSSIKKSLGFFLPNTGSYAHYVFIGTRESMERCQAICHRRGIEAEFVEGTEQTLPEGHSSMQLSDTERINVVYDIEAYSYDSIFRIFQAHSKPNISIGTYSPKTNIIITDKENII